MNDEHGCLDVVWEWFPLFILLGPVAALVLSSLIRHLLGWH